MIALTVAHWIALACAVAGLLYVCWYAVREYRWWRGVRQRNKTGSGPKDW
ncbi:MAG TPA: hypothetical protein VJP77_05880 [Planctomycetota bacterium]|nr:hypothetical protein [Planctomycetota bacterium]